MVLLAHVSDTHLDGDDRSRERAERVMSYLNGLRHPVDAVLVTGDIADHGRADEYEQARKVLSSPYPVLTCPGNHDVRGAYREVLLGQGVGRAPADGDAPVNQVHRVAGVTFALCDSSIPGRPEGLLADETLAWLEEVLTDAGDDGPVVVCFHHPPVLLHSPYVDGIRQHGEQRLADLVERHPRIVALLCGHAHTAAATTFAGVPLRVAPGVVSTLTLPWEQGEHGDVVDYAMPPALAFHVIDDDLRLTTHYRVIP